MTDDIHDGDRLRVVYKSGAVLTGPAMIRNDGLLAVRLDKGYGVLVARDYGGTLPPDAKRGDAWMVREPQNGRKQDMDKTELARRARLMMTALDERIAQNAESDDRDPALLWALLCERNRYEAMAVRLEQEAGREIHHRDEREERRIRKANLARGRKAGRARRKIGADYYQDGRFFWEYYEWGPGNKPCWFRTEPDAPGYGQVGQRYSLTCAETCADPRE